MTSLLHTMKLRQSLQVLVEIQNVSASAVMLSHHLLHTLHNVGKLKRYLVLALQSMLRLELLVHPDQNVVSIAIQTLDFPQKGLKSHAFWRFQSLHSNVITFPVKRTQLI